MVPAFCSVSVLQLSLTDEPHMCFPLSEHNFPQTGEGTVLLAFSCFTKWRVVANDARLNAKRHTRQLKCQCVHLKRRLPAQLGAICRTQADFLNKFSTLNKIMGWISLSSSFRCGQYVKKQNEMLKLEFPAELINCAEFHTELQEDYVQVHHFNKRFNSHHLETH